MTNMVNSGYNSGSKESGRTQGMLDAHRLVDGIDVSVSGAGDFSLNVLGGENMEYFKTPKDLAGSQTLVLLPRGLGFKTKDGSGIIRDKHFPDDDLLCEQNCDIIINRDDTVLDLINGGRAIMGLRPLVREGFRQALWPSDPTDVPVMGYKFTRASQVVRDSLKELFGPSHREVKLYMEGNNYNELLEKLKARGGDWEWNTYNSANAYAQQMYNLFRKYKIRSIRGGVVLPTIMCHLGDCGRVLSKPKDTNNYTCTLSVWIGKRCTHCVAFGEETEFMSPFEYWEHHEQRHIKDGLKMLVKGAYESAIKIPCVIHGCNFVGEYWHPLYEHLRDCPEEEHAAWREHIK